MNNQKQKEDLTRQFLMEAAKDMKFSLGPGAEKYIQDRDDAKEKAKPSYDKPLPFDYKKGKFDFQAYMALPTQRERLDYARVAADSDPVFNKIIGVGQGSSRIVYEMPGTGKVLKMAINNKGVGQNKAELEISLKVHMEMGQYPIVTKIFGHDKESEPTWLIAESVEPIDYTKDFLAITGIPFNVVKLFNRYGEHFDKNITDELLSKAIGGPNLNDILAIKMINKKLESGTAENPQALETYIKVLQDRIKASKEITPAEIRANPMFDSLMKLFDLGLDNGDSTDLRHWGKTEDGRAVLLDYGLTEEVMGKHYYNTGLSDRAVTQNFDESYKSNQQLLEVDGRNKLPRGRPPKDLQNALNLINNAKMVDDYDEELGPDDKKAKVVAEPTKTPASKMKFIKGPGAEAFTQGQADAKEKAKPSFDKPVPFDYKTGKFDLQEYMALEKASQRLDYANAAYQSRPILFSKLGQGSSRVVYDMPGTGKVLKMAINNKGVGQNKEEIEISFKAHMKFPDYPIVTKIFGHDDSSNPTWLISESVKELTNDAAFLAIAGVSFEIVIAACDSGGRLEKLLAEMAVNQKNKLIKVIDADILNLTNWLDQHKRGQVGSYPGQVQRYIDHIEVLTKGKAKLEKQTFQTIRQNPIIKSLAGLGELGLANGDTKRVEHWGETEDGRVVLLDYGFTPAIADKFYRNSWNRVDTQSLAEIFRQELK